jgi:hypothetical protein
MRSYARIQDGRVVELITTDSDISTMFHPALRWIEAPTARGIAEGWSYDGSVFSKPAVIETVAPPLSISEIQTQLKTLSAQLSTFTRTT